jgi:release factor glutamine methyltransferase
MLEAQMLAGHVLMVDRSWILAHPEAELPELAAIGLLERRENREPLAYIIGWREFYGRRFSIRPGALIPRQETETLIEQSLSLVLPDSTRVLDMGTGSGILAITLALEKPVWDVTATDISLDALAIASDNAHQLCAEVEFIVSDAFEALSDCRYDLIVSNPPYISTSAQLMPEVADFEPPTALFSGESGMEFYELLARESHYYLNPNGFLVVELGDGVSTQVVDVFKEQGWKIQRVQKDLLRIDRCLVCGR